MSESKRIERNEDMSPRGRLALILQRDGDVIVAIVPDPDATRWERDSVEFCRPGAGGGRSTHTLAALRALAEAMEKDNQENPIHVGR